ncbi:MAG TPA: hypothetical protein VLZ75_06840 [Chitinophagales bacterium]|nr:hypothetical protein [Chitinophagales bacterium]
MIAFTSVFVISCKDDEKEPEIEKLATTPLYDTLGAFIQGASNPAGQGTKMITDPEDKNKKIQAGRLAIRTVIQEAENVLAADPMMAEYFPTLLAEVGAGNTTGFIKLRETFTDLIQEVASGQKVYKGLDMVKTHDHKTNPRFGSDTERFADNAIFDQFLTDVVKAMTNLKVPASVQGQLGAALESTRKDVVQE